MAEEKDFNVPEPSGENSAAADSNAEHGVPEQGDVSGTAGADNTAPESESGSEPIEHFTLYKRPKRNGKFISKLSKDDADALQRRKSLYMYLSTLMFAVSLFLSVGGRTVFYETEKLFALFTLYVIALLVLIVLSVYIAFMNRTGQKIGGELKEKNVPRDGLDRHTFISYEFFNVLHILVAAAEVVISCLIFGAKYDAKEYLFGVINILVSVASAVFSVKSRQILFKANKDNLEYIPAREDEQEKPEKKKKR